MLGARNEAIIEANGREHRLLFTNRALAEAERTTSKSIVALLQGFSDGACGINELGHVMRAGLEAARRDGREGGKIRTLNEAFEILDEAGFVPVLQAVIESVSAVLGYDADDEDGDDEDGDSDPNA